MLRNIKQLQRMQVMARDGVVGSVDQFFFDDEWWTIRYLVIDTGNWLPGRRVLMSPISIDAVDWLAEAVRLSITRGMVESSPDIDTQKPVSRQQEMKYMRHYGYPHYWGGAGLWGPGPYPAGLVGLPAVEAQARVETELQEAQDSGDSHLRSSKEVLGYQVQARDGKLGHVESFLVEDESWTIRYLIVDTSNWWFGKHVLVSPAWVDEVSWTHRTVSVDLSRATIKAAPEYDAASHLDRQWEADYHAHLQRQPYWSAGVEHLGAPAGARRP